MRVALYSHDTKGLGHMRRNLRIAEALASKDVTVLLVAGAREAGSFAMPPGVDCLTLPAYSKDAEGGYAARHLSMSLDELLSLRAQTIRAAVGAFAPDLFIVDYAPRGGLGELMPTLEALGSETVCVLGLRDILGEPGFVGRNWVRADNEACIRKHFDAVWIYGDERVYDTIGEYRMAPDIASMTRYTGYVGRVRDDLAIGGLSEPYDLCLVGGGQDGANLALAFATAKRPRNGVVLTGPYMPEAVRKELHRLQAPDLRIVDFTPDPTGWLAGADRVLAMGGYNTMVEIIERGKRALIVPRCNSRQEQILRAERFAALGIVHCLDSDQLSSEAVSQWLHADVPVPPSLATRIDLSGASRIHAFMTELVSARRKTGTAA